MRILITGYPNCGKTTLARALHEMGLGYMRSTDELLDTHEWSDLSAEVATWFDEPGPWIIEGVAIPRAIRKWKAKHPKRDAPFDIFIFIRRSREGYLPGQKAMASGVDTVMLELWKWLDAKGILTFELGPKPEEK